MLLTSFGEGLRGEFLAQPFVVLFSVFEAGSCFVTLDGLEPV